MIRTVAGIDLGPATHNRSTGLLVATRKGNTGEWIISAVSETIWKEKSEKSFGDCNELLADAVSGARVVCIDAPLSLGPSKEWETKLIKSEIPDKWKPSRTSGILSHAWRAHDLNRLIRSRSKGTQVAEVYPASWFWCLDRGRRVAWKGNGDAKAKARKRKWYRSIRRLLNENSFQIDFSDGTGLGDLSGDELDALPCVICAVLVAEKGGPNPVKVDRSEPPVYFLPRELWNVNDTTKRVLDSFLVGQ